MREAFIVMQIGIPELDRVCSEAIVPAIKASNLEPRRVDKHNSGGLLKSEIISFIERSDIIIADLTNERPNCYLEIGYAMGIDKFKSLILTARKDHNHSAPDYNPANGRIHFDLIGYDILFWDPNDLPAFKIELEKRIKRRRTILAPSSETVKQTWDEVWAKKHRSLATSGLQKVGLQGFMEVRFALENKSLNKSQTELLKAADGAQIHTFGWPVGIVMTNDEYRPRSQVDGIAAEVLVAQPDRKSYDYWSLKRDGDYYLLTSLFEDMRKEGALFFNTRIVRVTETLLFCARLYNLLGVSSDTRVTVAIAHGGLKGRTVRAAGGVRHIGREYTSIENEVKAEVVVALSEIESKLVEMVKEILKPLFLVFDYFELSDQVYSDIVNNFVNGQTT